MGFVTAIYLRLSVDDDDRDESNSIQSQREMLRRYVSADPTLAAGEILEFADDGWSGTNFERPDVQKLLVLARRGGVQCIVVKDLSRWGRNYIEVNEYIEQIFPFLGIRFVSLGDSYDSDQFKGCTAPMDIAFTSLVHDLYCKELSMKIRQSCMAKAKKGEFVQGAAPYGYVKSAAEKKMLIDGEAAVVVRRIFSLACGGMKPARIAALLNAGKVDSPVMYQRRLGRRAVGYQSLVSGNGVWTEVTIRRILADERYMGILIYGKTQTAEVGGKKRLYLPESDWIKVPDTHEAVVDAETFQKAGTCIRRHKKERVKGSKVPFIGKLKCGCCNHALRFNPTQTPYFLCQGPSLNYGMGCSEERLYLDDLNNAVLAAVKAEAGKALDELQRRKEAGRRESTGRDIALAEHKRLAGRIAYLDRHHTELYDDFAGGKLDREAYLAAKAALASELAGAKARSAELTARLDSFATEAETPGDGPLLRRVLAAESVTDEVLSFIDCVLVYNPERIEVRFAFGDTNLLEG